jgi:hypothetical protein
MSPKQRRKTYYKKTRPEINTYYKKTRPEINQWIWLEYLDLIIVYWIKVLKNIFYTQSIIFKYLKTIIIYNSNWKNMTNPITKEN